MRKRRLEVIGNGFCKIVEPVESFCRFALRESWFSDALYSVSIGDGSNWQETTVSTALAVARSGNGYILIEYGDPSTMRSSWLKIIVETGVMQALEFYSGNILHDILLECGV